MHHRIIKTACATVGGAALALGAVTAASSPASANGGTTQCNRTVCVQRSTIAYVDVVGNGRYAGLNTVVWRGVFGGTGVAFNSGHAPASLGRHFHVPEIYMWRLDGRGTLLAYQL